MSGATAEFPAVETLITADKASRDSDNLEALDKPMIAALSPHQISEMTRDELVRLVEKTGLPITAMQCSVQLTCADRQTLERLVYLARRCCRNQGY